MNAAFCLLEFCDQFRNHMACRCREEPERKYCTLALPTCFADPLQSIMGCDLYYSWSINFRHTCEVQDVAEFEVGCEFVWL